METPEKSSDYVKRVLFGGGGSMMRPGAMAAPEVTGIRNNRSESHSSAGSSAPSAAGTVISSTPGTPGHTSGVSSLLHRVPSKTVYGGSNNASLAVFLRVRPPGVPGADVDKLSGRRTYQILEDQATLRTFPPITAAHSRTINRQAKDFGFTRVFGPSASQKDTYVSTTRPLVDDVFASQNALLFAYGMTNAGKTYTVLGEDGKPGLIPQALNDIFERLAKLEGDKPRVEMSFLEIYIENVYDLVAIADADEWAQARTALKLDDRMGTIQARDLSKHAISSASDGLDLVKRATANRRVASTKLNEDSSRSHSVCMIKLVREKGRDSNLWVVDLAGSERGGRTGAGASSTRQKEANNINKSLSTLWHCLTIMRANLRKDEPETRVPFRESKLTHLFKNHLQGPTAGKTVMVVNVNPSTEDFDETQAVLKNSTIAREVKTVRDDSAAARQNGLINTPYGFNGRKTQLKKATASRRSIHQAVAPKLDGLGLPPPRVQSPVRIIGSHGDTDCGSGREEEDGREDGYLSGAESDSGLVDHRQSMNLVVKNLQVDNETLKAKLQATLAGKQTSAGSRGHQPIAGGPLERYIGLLEDRVTTSEARMEEMREAHREELQELEEELESFLEENGLTGGREEQTISGAVMDDNVSAIAVERLTEEVRIANLTADQWKKEAETIRVRLEGIESRMSPASNASQGVGGAPGMVRTPLRQSTGSGSQGRPSLENRQDGENSPPGTIVNASPPPGGVGSPSKKAPRNTATPTKTKPSALPTKNKTKSPTKKKATAGETVPPPSPPQSPPLLPGAVATKAIAATLAAVATSEDVAVSHSEDRISTSPTTVSAPAPKAAVEAKSSSPPRESGISGIASTEDSSSSSAAATATAAVSKAGSKMVVAVSRRVSVLRGSTAGGRRVSNSVRASMAGGRSRRGSRASYADNHRSSYAGRRLSHLRGVRSSILWSVPAVTGERAGSMLGEGVLIGSAAGAGRVEADDDVYRSPSRRESAMIMAMATEDNFFEKARRVLLRAIGVGGSKGCSSASDGGAGNFEPVTAEEIEAKQKIKVKMPKRPCKKGIEFQFDALWGMENQSEDVIEEEEVVETETVESSSAVVNGIERWVFGAKEDRVKPARKPAVQGTPGISPMRTINSPADYRGKTIHDYVRAM